MCSGEGLPERADLMARVYAGDPRGTRIRSGAPQGADTVCSGGEGAAEGVVPGAFAGQPTLQQGKPEAASGPMPAEACAAGVSARQTGWSGAALAASASRAIAELPRRPDGRSLPTVVVPDVHGRKDMLARVLAFRGPDGQGIEDADGRVLRRRGRGEPATVLDLLRRGEINLVFQGDLVPSESRNQAQWLKASEQLRAGGGRLVDAMDANMEKHLGTLAMVSVLKTLGGDHVKIVQGDHDDVESMHAGRTFDRPSARRSRQDGGEGFGTAFSRSQGGGAYAVTGLQSAAAGMGATGDNEQAGVLMKRGVAPAAVAGFQRAVGPGPEAVGPGGHRPVSLSEAPVNDEFKVVMAVVPAGRAFDPIRDVFHLGNPYAA